MDRELQAHERAFLERPEDPQAAADLGRARLRAGRTAGALSVLRAFEELRDLRIAAAEALAARLSLTFVGLEPTSLDEAGSFERYRRGLGQGSQLCVLVPAGAYLEEGDRSERSLLSDGGRRADLRRLTLPDFVMDLRPSDQESWSIAREGAAAQGARLPTASEWKKALRGGLFLDGDESGRLLNPEPDRVVPGGTLWPERSTSGYGVDFRPGDLEWLHDGSIALARASEARFRVQVPPEVRDARRMPLGYSGRVVARFVHDVREPGGA